MANKFKIGDRVKIINKNRDNYGCVTTITEVPKDMRRWYVVAGGLKDKTENAPDEEDLELISNDDHLFYIYTKQEIADLLLVDVNKLKIEE